MNAPRMTMADLTDDQLATVRGLEDELGVWLVALRPEYQLADSLRRDSGKYRLRRRS